MNQIIMYLQLSMHIVFMAASIAAAVGISMLVIVKLIEHFIE